MSVGGGSVPGCRRMLEADVTRDGTLVGSLAFAKSKEPVTKDGYRPGASRRPHSASAPLRASPPEVGATRATNARARRPGRPHPLLHLRDHLDHLGPNRPRNPRHRLRVADPGFSSFMGDPGFRETAQPACPPRSSRAAGRLATPPLIRRQLAGRAPAATAPSRFRCCRTAPVRGTPPAPAAHRRGQDPPSARGGEAHLLVD